MFTMRKCEEFRSSEVASFTFQEKGNYAYFILRKKNWTTTHAIVSIAKELKIPPTRFSIASSTEKTSTSSQYVSVSHVSLGELRNVHLKDVVITPLGYAQKPIKSEDVDSIEYSIVVRHLDHALRSIHTFTNYFELCYLGRNPQMYLVGKALLQGDFAFACQLFLTSTTPHESPASLEFRKNVLSSWPNVSGLVVPPNLVQEKHIIAHLLAQPKDFKGACLTLDAYTLRSCIYMYQAYLFNKILTAYVMEHYPFVLYDDLALTSDIQDDVILPLLGYDFKLKSAGVGKIVADLLVEERINLTMFASFDVKTVGRSAFIAPAKLRVGPQERDKVNKQHYQMQKVQFHLPLSSFPHIALACMNSTCSS